MKNNLEGSSISVSLIIPIYNTEQFIERCLRSVFEQTFENVEYILINDCTPDKSIEVSERVIKQYPDRKVSIVNNQKNIGLAGVRNPGQEIQVYYLLLGNTFISLIVMIM